MIKYLQRLTPQKFSCKTPDVVPELVQGRQGHLIADEGLIRPQLCQELETQSLALDTPLKNNMKDTRPKAFVAQIMDIRRCIETVIFQLTQRYYIQTIRAKDM